MLDLFRQMSEQTLDQVSSIIPPDPIRKMIVFIEALRVLNYWAALKNNLPEDRLISKLPDYQIAMWGWNLVVEHFYTAIPTQGGFPLLESTVETRQHAFSILYKYGQSVLLKRAADMIKYGFLNVEYTKDNYILRISDLMEKQFIDEIEFNRLDEIEKYVSNINKKWQCCSSTEEIDAKYRSIGNYNLGRRFKNISAAFPATRVRTAETLDNGKLFPPAHRRF